MEKSAAQHVDLARVKEIFILALSLTADARTLALDELCHGDSTLRAAVESLLKCDGSVTLLDRPISELADAGLSHEQSEDEELLGPLPEQIGPFKVVGVLGMGSGGLVYRALQQEPRREVAIKVLRADAPVSRRRFERESQFMAALNHRGIAQVYERGVDGALSLPYIAMELVPGALPITEFATRKQLGVPARVDLFIHACDAVSHAHAAGVLHRDLKPANLLVDESGHVKIVDFGVGRWLASPGTLHGAVVGTLNYTSPEQMRGQAGTFGDVYSLGAVLYELLCGRPPIEFEPGNMIDAATRIENDVPVAPRTLNPSCSRNLSAVVLKALEKLPQRRYATVAQFADDLRSVIMGLPVSARSEALTDSMRRLVRRRPAVVATVLAVTMVSLVWGMLAWRQQERQLAAASRLSGAALRTLDFIESRLGSTPLRHELVETYFPLAEELVRARPRDADARYLLARICDVKADLCLQAMDIPPVRTLRQRSLELFSGLAEENPASVDYAHRESLAMVRMGDVVLREGNYEEGTQWYRSAMAMQQRLVDAGATDATLLDDLGWSCLRMSDIAFNAGRMDEVLSFVDRQLALASRVESLDRSSPTPYWALLAAHHQASRVLDVPQRREDYERHIRAALGAADRLIQISPDERRYLSHYVLRAYDVAMRIEIPAGRIAQAMELSAKAASCVATLKRLDEGTHETIAADCTRLRLAAAIKEHQGAIAEARSLAEECVVQAQRLGAYGPNACSGDNYRNELRAYLIHLSESLPSKKQ